jgi:hypothetical protein
MDKNSAIAALKLLIENHIGDADLKSELITRVDSAPRSPVRGIIIHSLDQAGVKFTHNESTLVKDLVFYYG